MHYLHLSPDALHFILPELNITLIRSDLRWRRTLTIPYRQTRSIFCDSSRICQHPRVPAAYILFARTGHQTAYVTRAWRTYSDTAGACYRRHSGSGGTQTATPRFYQSTGWTRRVRQEARSRCLTAHFSTTLPGNLCLPLPRHCCHRRTIRRAGTTRSWLGSAALPPFAGVRELRHAPADSTRHSASTYRTRRQRTSWTPFTPGSKRASRRQRRWLCARSCIVAGWRRPSCGAPSTSPQAGGLHPFSTSYLPPSYYLSYGEGFRPAGMNISVHGVCHFFFAGVLSFPLHYSAFVTFLCTWTLWRMRLRGGADPHGATPPAHAPRLRWDGMEHRVVRSPLQRLLPHS